LLEGAEDRPPNEMISQDYTDLRTFMPKLSYNNMASITRNQRTAGTQPLLVKEEKLMDSS